MLYYALLFQNFEHLLLNNMHRYHHTIIRAVFVCVFPISSEVL